MSLRLVKRASSALESLADDGEMEERDTVLVERDVVDVVDEAEEEDDGENSFVFELPFAVPT